MKLKTYVLTVSRRFPANHKRKGEATYFPEKILKGQEKCLVQIYEEFGSLLLPKLHTIRGNYEIWKKRADEINKGKAILSIRYWSDKPYRSPQVEICQLTKIGIQKVRLEKYSSGYEKTNNYGLTIIEDKCTKVKDAQLENVANNDGLAFSDFSNWFFPKDNPVQKFEGVILHFTDFRY